VARLEEHDVGEVGAGVVPPVEPELEDHADHAAAGGAERLRVLAAVTGAGLDSVIVACAWLAVAVNWEWVFALIFFLEWQAISGYLGSCLYLGLRSIVILLLYGGSQGWGDGKNSLAVVGLCMLSSGPGPSTWAISSW
jgi:hypothetical protein